VLLRKGRRFAYDHLLPGIPVLHILIEPELEVDGASVIGSAPA
jgi:hypothetical protein